MLSSLPPTSFRFPNTWAKSITRTAYYLEGTLEDAIAGEIGRKHTRRVSGLASKSACK